MPEDVPIHLFAEAVTRLRKNQKMSRNSFAKECGCSPNSIRSWEEETASPSLNHIWAISEAMGVSFDVVLGKDTSDESISLAGLTTEEKTIIRKTVQIFRNGHKLT